MASISPSHSAHPSLLPFLSSTSLPKTHFRKPRVVLASVVKLSEAERIPILIEKGELDGRIPVGAGVYDSDRDLQFVGMSRSVSMSVKKHRRWVSELCSSVKVGPTSIAAAESTESSNRREDVDGRAHIRNRQNPSRELITKKILVCNSAETLSIKKVLKAPTSRRWTCWTRTGTRGC